MSQQKNVIQCPKCGYEYLPGEIFLPNQFLGQPRDIEKEYTGKILDYGGIEQNLHESYICDKCGCHFNVEATIAFTTKIDKRFEDEDHTTEKYADRIQLSEE